MSNNENTISFNQDEIDTLAKFISIMPKVIVDQFIIIAKGYTEYINAESLSNDDRIKYINSLYNAINMLNKLIAISSNGIPVEQQVMQQKRARAEDASDTQEESDSNNTEAQEQSADNAEESSELPKTVVRHPSGRKKLTSELLISEELAAWEIPEDSFTYKLVSAMPNFYNNKSARPEPLEVIRTMAEATAKKPNVVASAFSTLVKKANLGNSRHTKLAYIPREAITKDMMINTLLNLCLIGE